MNKTLKDFMKSELMIRAAVGLLVYFMILFSCGKSGSNRKDPPFWITMANNTGNTTSIVHSNANNPALGNRPSGSGGANPAAAPVEGMYFFHPDHLGSVSMVTDAHGKMVTGMDIDSGMSYITYKPYGEINRTNSSGPDIYRYKYTAQEDDPELGLYYYKARWYDPGIARFTQADSIIDANSVQGMNQYMYTEGNPVNFRDPSGHKKMDALMGKIASAMMMARIFNKDDNSATTNYYRLVMLSKMMSSRNKKGSWYNRSDLSTAANWTSPMNIIGAAWAGHNYISGRLMGLNTQIHQDRYGFHVTDAPHMNGGDTGINMGYFSVQAGDRENTTRHENAHKQQFHQWGADAYTGVFGLRLTGRGAGWPETNADRRAGTFAYDRINDTLFIYLRLIDFVRSKDLNQYSQDGFIADYGYVK